MTLLQSVVQMNGSVRAKQGSITSFYGFTCPFDNVGDHQGEVTWS